MHTVLNLSPGPGPAGDFDHYKEEALSALRDGKVVFHVIATIGAPPAHLQSSRWPRRTGELVAADVSARISQVQSLGRVRSSLSATRTSWRKVGAGTAGLGCRSVRHPPRVRPDGPARVRNDEDPLTSSLAPSLPPQSTSPPGSFGAFPWRSGTFALSPPESNATVALTACGAASLR